MTELHLTLARNVEEFAAHAEAFPAATVERNVLATLLHGARVSSITLSRRTQRPPSRRPGVTNVRDTHRLHVAGALVSARIGAGRYREHRPEAINALKPLA